MRKMATVPLIASMLMAHDVPSELRIAIDQFQEALDKNDIARMNTLITYPLQLNWVETINTPDDFKLHYRQIFTKARKTGFKGKAPVSLKTGWRVSSSDTNHTLELVFRMSKEGYKLYGIVTHE